MRRVTKKIGDAWIEGLPGSLIEFKFEFFRYLSKIGIPIESNNWFLAKAPQRGSADTLSSSIEPTINPLSNRLLRFHMLINLSIVYTVLYPPRMSVCKAKFLSGCPFLYQLQVASPSLRL